MKMILPNIPDNAVAISVTVVYWDEHDTMKITNDLYNTNYIREHTKQEENT